MWGCAFGHRPVKNFYGRVFNVRSFNLQCMDGTEEAVVEEKCARCGEYYPVGRTKLPARIREQTLELRVKGAREKVMDLANKL